MDIFQNYGIIPNYKNVVDKFCEVLSKKQEARSRKQEARSRKQEARKQEARSTKAGRRKLIVTSSVFLKEKSIEKCKYIPSDYYVTTSPSKGGLLKLCDSRYNSPAVNHSN
ncbi:MAG: hypothetical protein HKN48_08545 [Flavobacteriaceae bacterium]|nr:hypothetical protein [Flavobacteriaceae bacterium]